MQICSIIVTYNRKELLGRCVQAVLAQTRIPKTLLIVDNASTDDTFAYLADLLHWQIQQYIKEDTLLELDIISGCSILYYRRSQNGGGAGGFFTGLKEAHERGIYDAYWLMDDDGYPSENCLEMQLCDLYRYDYVMPVSVDISNHSQLSWETRKRDNHKTINLSMLRASWGKIMPFVFPFNGCLLSKKIVDKVGYINPNLFIWGDDYEHYFRCLNAGFTPVTLLDAEFYHPVNRAPAIPIFFGKFPVPYVESKLRFVCLIRNWAYIHKKNHHYYKLLRSFAAYSWLFLITRKLDFIGYKLFLASYVDGLTENFERHKQYL